MKQKSLLALLTLLALLGCSDDSEQKPVPQRLNFNAQSCAIGYEEEAGARAISPTRRTPSSPSWAAGYYLYNDLNSMFADQKDLQHKSISVFFTKDDADPLAGTFFYSEFDSKWHLNNTEVTPSEYFLYGFIPTEDADRVTIAPNTAYSNGAVLTIHGLNAVTPSDVCVIIGAKDGTDEDHVTDLQAGMFATRLNATDNTGHNYIFLLFDHLYSALRFRFTIDAEYAKLRVIKLRKLELVAYSNNSEAGVKAKYDATITLRKNNTGMSPIVGNVSFTPVTTSNNVDPVALYDWRDNVANYIILQTDTPTEFMGTFVPGDNVYFKLRSTYDVFDRQGNLVRQGCQAENTIDLREKFGSFLATTRGHSYTYTITVQPTYLYVLSEPDLDNPTVRIN